MDTPKKSNNNPGNNPENNSTQKPSTPDLAEWELDEDDLLPSQAGPTQHNPLEKCEIILTIPEDHAGSRLDKALTQLLAGQIEGISRARLQSLMEEGQISPKSALSKKVRAGDSYTIKIPPAAPIETPAEDIPLDIVYEDNHVIVINKPAGMVVHPAAGNWTGTLVNALLHHCQESLSGIGGAQRPGIVHRLDKDTSGLIVVAKNDIAHQKLTEQFADRTLSRTYLAVVWGVPMPRQGTIIAPIGRDPKDRKKMAVLHPRMNRQQAAPTGAKYTERAYEEIRKQKNRHEQEEMRGKEAITDYTVERVFAGGHMAVVRCRLQTGRTHQIRVHMSYIHTPIVGDQLYGGRKKKAIENFTRQALHAAEIQFRHPDTGEMMHFTAPLPNDFLRLMNSL